MGASSFDYLGFYPAGSIEKSRLPVSPKTKFVDNDIIMVNGQWEISSAGRVEKEKVLGDAEDAAAAEVKQGGVEDPADTESGTRWAQTPLHRKPLWLPSHEEQEKRESHSGVPRSSP